MSVTKNNKPLKNVDNQMILQKETLLIPGCQTKKKVTTQKKIITNHSLRATAGKYMVFTGQHVSFLMNGGDDVLIPLFW